MTPTQPPRPHLVPTSSLRRDDLTQATSSVVPHPYGGRGRTETSKITTTTNAPPRPRDEVRTCRSCGCTDDNACWPTCWWIEPDLCSSCGGPR
jgi:hypothetical protein